MVGRTAFGDLRGWIEALRAAGELEEIGGEVDWNVEIGNVVRMLQGSGDGPAFLFSNIKDYNGPDAVCSRIFTGGQASYSRIAMMFGLERDTPVRELVRICRTIFQERIEPRVVKDGPVKRNVVAGGDVDLLEFPVPKWNRLDGGRYVLTYAGCVTKDPDTGVHNVGIYRGMVGGPASIPVLMWRAQALGSALRRPRAARRRDAGRLRDRMGAVPRLHGRSAGAPQRVGIRGDGRDPRRTCRSRPVRNRAADGARVGRNRHRGLDFDRSLDLFRGGPLRRVHRILRDGRTRKHTTRVTCITHRDDPIFRGTVEGAIPGSVGENPIMSSIQRSAVAWNALESAGVPGVVGVFGHPIHAAVNVNVAIRQTYRGQARQVAAALWGDSSSHVRYKHVTVVDDDIDIHDYEAVDWACAWRFNAGEDDIMVYPANWGAGLDPSVRRRDADALRFGTGKWSRVLVDATVNLDYEPERDGRRYPPTVGPSDDDMRAIEDRWDALKLSGKWRKRLGSRPGD